MVEILTIGAIIIIVGLVLRYGSSSIDLVKSTFSGLYQETSLLTLQNTANGSYPYYGPTGATG